MFDDVKCNNFAKPQISVLNIFEKQKSQVLNNAKKEKYELIESQKLMAPMILGSTATVESALDTVTLPKFSPKKISTRRLSFGELILSKKNSSFDNETENEATLYSLHVPTKHIGKQIILLPLSDTNAKCKLKKKIL